MLNPQFRIVGFPCQGSDKMTQAAGGACCAPSYSDVKYEALPYELVLHPEVLAPLASRPGCFLVLAAGMWVKEVLSRY